MITSNIIIILSDDSMSVSLHLLAIDEPLLVQFKTNGLVLSAIMMTMIISALRREDNLDVTDSYTTLTMEYYLFSHIDILFRA